MDTFGVELRGIRRRSIPAVCAESLIVRRNGGLAAPDAELPMPALANWQFSPYFAFDWAPGHERLCAGIWRRMDHFMGQPLAARISDRPCAGAGRPQGGWAGSGAVMVARP